MQESIFEQIEEQAVSFYVNLLALVFPAVAVLTGALIGKLRGRLGRSVALSILYGLIGPVVCLYWHLYDARTSYWDWVYLEKNPETYERLFWIGRPTPAARARAREREEAGEKGVVIVEGTWKPARFWEFVQPYPLYSVRGLGMFALATLVAAGALGLLAGLVIRKIDRTWPPPQSLRSQEATAEADADGQAAQHGPPSDVAEGGIAS